MMAEHNYYLLQARRNQITKRAIKEDAGGATLRRNQAKEARRKKENHF